MVDAACTREIDAFMANVLKTYNKPQITHSDAYVQRELVNAYGDMVAQCGRLLMKAGAALDAAAKKIALQSTVVTPDARRAYHRRSERQVLQDRGTLPQPLSSEKIWNEGNIP